MNYQYQINKEMLLLARKQFCLDVGLEWQQYLAEPGKKCYIQKTSYRSETGYPLAEGARCYHGTDAFFKAIMCMGQLFLSVDEKLYDWAVEKFTNYPPEWFCEFGNLRRIDEKLKEYGREIKDTHVYFLPRQEAFVGQQDIALLNVLRESEEYRDRQERETNEQPRSVVDEDASMTVRSEAGGAERFIYQWYEQEEILQFKEKNRFTSAICFSPTQPDVLAVAALSAQGDTALYGKHGKQFDQSQMAGMAGVSADGEYLWQIGINVTSEYAGHGLGVKLVRQLKEEIIRRGKVPFYGTSESHTVSQSIAIKSGFVPAWTEIYVKSIEN